MLRPELRSAVRFRPSASSMAVTFCVLLIAGRLLRGSAFPPPVSQAGEYFVERVDDDSSLVLTTGQRVRLLGVREPEEDGPLKQEITAFLRSLVEGRHVTLELDRTRIDRQFRTLAWVHSGEQLVNAELVRRGYGTVDPRIPMQSDRLSQLEDAEEQARSAGAGIWSGR